MCFNQILAWQPSWSCDQHHVNEFSLPCTVKLTYKICLRMAQWSLRKANFNFHVNGLGPRSRNDLDIKYSHAPYAANRLSFQLPIEAPHEYSVTVQYSLVSDLVENLEDRFSHIAAHMSTDHIKLYK